MNGIDLHAHILPGVDHGSTSLDESCTQLKMMKNAGIDTVVATPHFYPEAHDATQLISQIDRVLPELEAIPLSERPRLMLGAEVLICTGLHHLPQLEQLCIRGTRILLLELPFSGCTDVLFAEVEDILAGGYTVVLAHIDRYVKKYGHQIDELLSMGALAQINAIGLRGFLNRRRLKPYWQSDCVVGFGTDLHGTSADHIEAYKALGRLPNDAFSQITARTRHLLQDATVW